MKKGVVFTFDAMIALIIAGTAVPLILLFSSVQTDSSTQVINLQTESAMETFSVLTIRNILREPAVLDLYNQGVITAEDLDKTVMTVVFELWASNSTINNTRAQNITQGLMGVLLPAGSEWVLSIENETIFDTGGAPKKTVGIGRRVSSGFTKGQQSAGYIASIFLTSIGGKFVSSYYFFGGFAGQGNITAPITDIPQNTTISEIYLEMNGGERFDFYVNNVFCRSMNVTIGNFTVDSWTINSSTCLNQIVKSGQNNLTLNFTGGNLTNEYIGGGYVRVTYSTSDLLQAGDGKSYYRFPGVHGLINLYDSFYVPGNVTEINANITFLVPVNYSALLYIGNATVLNATGTNQKVTAVINNSNFSQALLANGITYQNISFTTVPIRMFVAANISGGNLTGDTDVVLITDLSGSMAWRINQDSITGNTVNNCNDPQIYNPNTSRISLAKCLDKSFVNAILGGPNSTCGNTTGPTGNRVAIVGFSSSANTWENLSNNVTYLESRINLYTTSGGTCISCGINRAYQILMTQSNTSRNKYIVIMTDGVANYRTTPLCYDMDDISLNISVGSSGATVVRLPPWNATNTGGTADNLNGVAVLNSTLARAVADGGEIYSWTGYVWTLEQDTGSDDIYGIDIFNSTLAFAVGASAKIWRWNGATWSQDADFGSFNFRGVAFLNDTWAFAVGDSGVIYRWNSTTWLLYQDVGSADLYSVDVKTSTLGAAVGTSGKIYLWNGATWTESTDTGGNTHYDVAIVNTTKVFTASSDGRAYEWNGISWANTLLSSYAIRGVYVVNSTLAYSTGDSRGDVYEWNGFSWSRTRSSFYYAGNSTTGLDCNDNNVCSTSISDTYSALNANYSAYRALTDLNNMTIDAVGLGPVGSCTLGNQTVVEIAKSGNGTSYTSADAAELNDIYCEIARNILIKPTPTQQIVTQGLLTPTILYPESFIVFNYTQPAPPGYQEISVETETSAFPGCSGQVFLVKDINITTALRTSYSGFYWTKGMYINNSLTGGFVSVYNLSSYRRPYTEIGDPFKVYLPPNVLAYNQTNTIRNELGLNFTHVTSNCSQYDRVIYSGRLRASVPYGNVFPQLSGGVIRVYYDNDHDGAADGYDDIAVGSGLPGFNPTPRTTDQLDVTNNALHDAVIRLMNLLNFVPQQIGVAGTQTNPIDIRLSNMNVDVSGTGGIPFAWGPLNIQLSVKV